MKLCLLLLAALLGGCGSDDSGSGGSSLNVDLATLGSKGGICIEKTCLMDIVATFTTPTAEALADGWALAMVNVEADKAPGECTWENSKDTESETYKGAFVVGKTYSLRGCAFNKSEGYYSPGLVIEAFTPELIKD